MNALSQKLSSLTMLACARGVLTQSQLTSLGQSELIPGIMGITRTQIGKDGNGDNVQGQQPIVLECLLGPLSTPWTPVRGFQPSDMLLPPSFPSEELIDTDDPVPATPLSCQPPTYRPHVRRRKKKHGFLVRMRTPGGRQVIARKKKKGRWRLSCC